MIKINLLPVREIKRRAKAKKEILMILISFFAFLFFLFFVSFFIFISVQGLKKELTSQEEEKKKYDLILKQIDKLEKEKQLIAKRIDIINQLKESSSVTVHILDDIAMTTPKDRIWLTELSQESSQVKIAGMALDNQTVAKYMDDLEGSSYIQNVILIKSDLKKYAERDLKDFVITSAVSTPNQSEKTTEPVNTNLAK